MDFRLGEKGSEQYEQQNIIRSRHYLLGQAMSLADAAAQATPPVSAPKDKLHQSEALSTNELAPIAPPSETVAEEVIAEPLITAVNETDLKSPAAEQGGIIYMKDRVKELEQKIAEIHGEEPDAARHNLDEAA